MRKNVREMKKCAMLCEQPATGKRDGVDLCELHCRTIDLYNTVDAMPEEQAKDLLMNFAGAVAMQDCDDGDKLYDAYDQLTEVLTEEEENVDTYTSFDFLKCIAGGCETIDEVIDVFEGHAEYFKEMKENGVEFDLSNINDGHIEYSTKDPVVAKKYGFYKVCRDCGTTIDEGGKCECTSQ